MPHTKPSPRWRTYLKSALRIAVSAALLAAVLLSVDLSKTIATLSHTRPLFVLLTAAALLAQVVCNAYKLMVLVRCRVPTIRLPQMIRTVFISLFVGEFFPGTLGMEAARMYGVARDTADPALSFSAVLMDRIMGLTGLMTVILLGVFIDQRGILHGIEYWAWGALALIVAAWLTAMTRPCRRLVDRLLQPPFLRIVRDKVKKIYACMDAFRRRPLVLAWSFLLAVLYNTIRAMTVFFAARALNIHAPLAAFLIIVPLVILAVQIPITISGLGLREMTFVSLFHTYYAVSKESTLAMVFLLVVTGLCVEVSPGGVLLIITRSRRASPRTKATPNSTRDPIPNAAANHL